MALLLEGFSDEIKSFGSEPKPWSGVAEITSCRDIAGCKVRRDLYMLVAVIVAYTATFLVALQYLSLLSQSAFPVAFASLVLLTVVTGLVHEVVHYVVARHALGKPARIGIIASYGALIIEYDEVWWSEWICIALAPQIFVTLPIAAIYAVARDPLLYVLLVLHLLASAPDIMNIMRAVAVFRGCRFRLCKEGKKVVGYAVIKPDNTCIFYKLIL